jgi:hypothetical protein
MRNCLIVGMFSQQDTGTWTIKATNCFGWTNRSFSLNVTENLSETFTPATPQPTNQSSEAISTFTAKSNISNVPTKIASSTNISVWVYIGMGIGVLILSGVLVLLIYLRFHNKGLICLDQKLHDVSKSER